MLKAHFTMSLILKPVLSTFIHQAFFKEKYLSNNNEFNRKYIVNFYEWYITSIGANYNNHPHQCNVNRTIEHYNQLLSFKLVIQQKYFLFTINIIKWYSQNNHNSKRKSKITIVFSYENPHKGKKQSSTFL